MHVLVQGHVDGLYYVPLSVPKTKQEKSGRRKDEAFFLSSLKYDMTASDVHKQLNQGQNV